MRARLRKLSPPAIVTRTKDSRCLIRFTAEIESPSYTGSATLDVLTQDPPPPTLSETLLSRQFDFLPGVASIKNFVPTDTRDPCAIPAAAPGEILFQGQITSHLISGEGSLFSCNDIAMPIYCNQLPPNALELHPGTFVAFIADGFTVFLNLS